MRVSETTCIVVGGVWITFIVLLCAAAYILSPLPNHQLAALVLVSSAVCMILLSPFLYRLVQVERTYISIASSEPW